MTTSIWDSPDMAASNGEFIKFTNVGDAVSGHVESVGRKTWDDGSVSPQIDLMTDDGEAKILTAGQVRLKLALAEKRPEIGDHLAVELIDIIKRPGGKTLKEFRVDVVKGGKAKAGAKAAPAGSSADQAPF